MDFIGKKYKMISSENFDEFMKAIGKFLLIVFDVSEIFLGRLDGRPAFANYPLC